MKARAPRAQKSRPKVIDGGKRKQRPGKNARKPLKTAGSRDRKPGEGSSSTGNRKRKSRFMKMLQEQSAKKGNGKSVHS